MHRFYCPDSKFSENTIRLTNKDELHHMRHVLRLKNQERISLFNGKDTEAIGSIHSINTREAVIIIESKKIFQRKSPTVILACAIPKKSKFETIIEKATELNVDEIIPIITERTQLKLNEQGGDKKTLRYHSIAVNAVKQCLRITIPQIHAPKKFPEVLHYLKKRNKLYIPSLQEKDLTLFKAITRVKPTDRIAFLIGPEGDFTPDEYAQAERAGAIAVTLGKNVLRVETAALCVLSCSLVHFALQH